MVSYRVLYGHMVFDFFFFPGEKKEFLERWWPFISRVKTLLSFPGERRCNEGMGFVMTPLPLCCGKAGQGCVLWKRWE